MIKFAILAVLLAVALIQQTGADTCSYNHCYKVSVNLEIDRISLRNFWQIVAVR